jgi:hypothetical protein
MVIFISRLTTTDLNISIGVLGYDPNKIQISGRTQYVQYPTENKNKQFGNSGANERDRVALKLYFPSLFLEFNKTKPLKLKRGMIDPVKGVENAG